MSTDSKIQMKIRTVQEDMLSGAGSGLETMTITPELFEKLYLSPRIHEIGDLKKRFANPTPLGLMGFVLSASTFSMILMGWGGATTPAAITGVFFFTGPFLLGLATIFEWLMGNFFSMMVMGMFTVFWLSLGVLQAPTWEIAASYSATGNAAEGSAAVGYNAAIALYLLVWGFWLFTIFIFSLKTNVVSALIFLCAFVSAFCISGAYWKVSTGDYGMASHLQKAGGALFFVLALLGYYQAVAIMATEMRLTTKLPVGDLAHFWVSSSIGVLDVEKQVRK